MLAVLRGACSPGAQMLPSKDGAAAAGEAAGAAASGAPAPALEECPICFEDMEAPTLTPCGHSFCNECIVRSDPFHSCSV
jgi:hypothetical protein